MTTLILPTETTRVPRNMSHETIYVAPLSLVETTVADANVSHLVTLINGETLIDTPPGIGPDRHLRLAMNDICEPQPGLVLPCRHACRRPHQVRPRMGPASAAPHPLLGGHQPLHGGSLHLALRAQSRRRGA